MHKYTAKLSLLLLIIVEASIYDEGVLSEGVLSGRSLCLDGVMYGGGFVRGGFVRRGVCPTFGTIESGERKRTAVFKGKKSRCACIVLISI